MPPRIPVFQCLRVRDAPPASTVTRSFTSTPCPHASTVAQKRKHRDPYAIAQAKARKAANLSRQQVLKKERAGALGDPVRGTTTPFVQSFDTALPPEPSRVAYATGSGAKTDTANHLNFYLSNDELESGVKRSKWLTQPLPSQTAADEQAELEATPSETTFEQAERQSGTIDPDSNPTAAIQQILGEMSSSSASQDRPDWTGSAAMLSEYTTNITAEDRARQVEQEHENAQEALRRIASLALGSSKDRTRINVQRCVDVFGRHNTDQSLPSLKNSQRTESLPEGTPRMGPDTGSSEVQIAVLTAKIRALADFLETRGHGDKVNKRNLRLLVHRRAKLLKYLRRKERGGPRWQHLVETLGLTDGTWKGEISL